MSQKKQCTVDSTYLRPEVEVLTSAKEVQINDAYKYPNSYDPNSVSVQVYMGEKGLAYQESQNSGLFPERRTHASPTSKMIAIMTAYAMKPLPMI